MAAKKAIVLGILLIFAQHAHAVSMNFKGHFRTEAAYFSNGSLGLANMNPNKAYLNGRVLLRPELIVDDHFSIKSQWSLLNSPTLTASKIPMCYGQGSYIYGDVEAETMVLCRAWLEWTSDFGVFRLGRMPVSWGYGLLWDAGLGVWDDFGTTTDRIEYRLHLGHVVGALAYSKPRKLTDIGNENDSDFYTAYLQYDNAELDIEGGFIYEKQVRSTGQSADLSGTSKPANSPNPYQVPPGYAGVPPPLAVTFPHPLSNDVIDAYLKKSFGYFTLGAEVGWLLGKAIDYGADEKLDDLDAFGVVTSITYEYHTMRVFLEALFASGDSNLKDNSLDGFVLLHRNRRLGMILGHELLGPYYGRGARLGSHVVYGDQDSFSGLLAFRPGIRFDWSNSWSTGAEVIIARKAVATSAESAHLGIEIDAGVQHSPYNNFDLGFAMGYLFAGEGLRVPSPKGVFAIKTTAALKF